MTQILLLIYGVMCSVTGAWVQADVFGLRPRLVFDGQRAITANVWCFAKAGLLTTKFN